MVPWVPGIKGLTGTVLCDGTCGDPENKELAKGSVAADGWVVEMPPQGAGAGFTGCDADPVMGNWPSARRGGSPIPAPLPIPPAVPEEGVAEGINELFGSRGAEADGAFFTPSKVCPSPGCCQGGSIGEEVAGAGGRGSEVPVV